MIVQRSTVLIIVLLIVGTWLGRPAVIRYFSAAEQPLRKDDRTPVFASVALGWRIEPQRVMPETVACLVPTADRRAELIYVGTGPDGGVYRFNPDLPATYLTIATFLGDLTPGGNCVVSNLAITDLDGDRRLELVAHTNQIHPRGRPKLCVWSIDPIPHLRAMARPVIESSWNHGLATTNVAHTAHRSLLSTYCGHGELVVYFLMASKSPTGFASESLAWRQVGKLPTSGEQVLRADADNDGRDDVALALGFRVGQAEIRIYSRNRRSRGEPTDLFVFGAQSWYLTHVLDEGHRFGNVRFAVGPRTKDGENDVYAWWCSDLAGGECEWIRYRLGPEGVRERERLLAGPAHEYWPLESQIALADLTGDGSTEVWFATGAGALWCYDPSASEPLRRICTVAEGFGCLAAGIESYGKPRRLYLASGRHVYSLQATRQASMATVVDLRK